PPGSARDDRRIAGRRARKREARKPPCEFQQTHAREETPPAGYGAARLTLRLGVTSPVPASRVAPAPTRTRMRPRPAPPPARGWDRPDPASSPGRAGRA